MPIYEYQCTHCQRTFEVFHRSSNETMERCQFCGEPVKRLISPSAFILKGSGFYVNDYPSESRKKGMESEKEKPRESEGENPS